MSDIRSMAIQRNLSQIRGELVYTLQYRTNEETAGEIREISVFLLVQSDPKRPKKEEIRSWIGRKIVPTSVYEIFQILIMKTGSKDQNLTYHNSENDSPLMELLMNSEMIAQIANQFRDIIIESVIMIHEDGNQIEGAPNQINTTKIGIGLTW